MLPQLLSDFCCPQQGFPTEEVNGSLNRPGTISNLDTIYSQCREEIKVDKSNTYLVGAARGNKDGIAWMSLNREFSDIKEMDVKRNKRKGRWGSGYGGKRVKPNNGA